MLDICLAGTGGMMPLPYRFLTALMLRYNGSQLLIDCGEGTQVALRRKGWSFKPIDWLLITHFHADHVSGLPGLLLSMGNAGRTAPLTIVGPRGLERVVNSLRVIVPELPFEIHFTELASPVERFEAGAYKITAFRLRHSIPCYGYSVEIPRAGRFQAEKAQALGLPVKLWNPLQKGNIVEYEGRAYFPEMVMGPPRRGLKVAYVTDTRPTQSIEVGAAGADLFICEGMYGGEDAMKRAEEHKHMCFAEAAQLARKAGVKEMWLTHYSPSLNRPQDFLSEAASIFPNTVAAEDGMSRTLKFEKE